MPHDRNPDLLKRLEAAARRLPPATREIFLAHLLDGLSFGEIAKRTGRPVRDVERHVERALRGLSGALDNEPRRWWDRFLPLWPWIG